MPNGSAAPTGVCEEKGQRCPAPTVALKSSRNCARGHVNNAGYLGFGAIEDVTDDEARRQPETVALAPVRPSSSFFPVRKAAVCSRVKEVQPSLTTAQARLGG